MIRIVRLILLASLLILLLPAAGFAEQDDLTEAELLLIARAAVAAQLDALTQTRQADSLGVDPSAYASGIQVQLADAIGKRAFLLERGLWYSGYSTKLQLTETKVLGSDLMLLRATEHTALQIAADINDPLAPKTYAYELPHDFTFALQNALWVLVSDKTEPFGSLVGNGRRASEDELMPDSKDVANIVAPDVAITINRSAVVQYAYQYWQNYNPNYRRFDGNGQGGDCTNFVSQAMRAGGWTFTNGLDWRSTREWWYNAVTQTYTWVNVDYFYTFLRYANRGNTVLTFIANFSPTGSFFNPLATGDLLQFDIAPPNGSYDHNMIITSKDSRGYIYLTYHTTNTRDRPILDLMYATPNYAYRGIRVY